MPLFFASRMCRQDRQLDRAVGTALKVEADLDGRKVQTSFANFDKDGNGFLEVHESIELARAHGLSADIPFDTAIQMAAAIHQVDRDLDGRISLAEFDAGRSEMESAMDEALRTQPSAETSENQTSTAQAK